MKYKIMLMLKSFGVTVFILTFLSAMLITLNENKKKMDGQGVAVYLNKDSLCVRHGRKEIKVEPDKKEIRKFLNCCYKNPMVLPFPFNLMVFSKWFYDDLNGRR